MTILEAVRAERAKYGALVTPFQAVELLNAVAWQFLPDVGLYSAPAGGNGARHPNGFVRLDILADKRDGRHYDVLINGPDALENAPGTAEPGLRDAGPLDPDRFVTPVKPIMLVPPASVPPAPVPPGGLPPARPGEIHTAIDLLRELLEPFERIARAFEELAVAAQAQASAVERVERDGLKVKWP